MTAKAQGKRLNQLLRYQAIKADYDQFAKLRVPTTVIHREHIYPKYFISRGTLYNILCTPIEKELRELNAIEVNQPVQVSLDL